MSDTNVEDVKKQESLHDPDPKDDVGSDNNSEDDKKDLNEHKNDGNPMPSSHQEEEVIKKKYGGLIPKKPPLISKDHERAYFDSADWALGKQGAQKPKGPLEALRPKLQPTQQHARSRRSAYAPADDSEVDGCNNHASSEDQSAAEDVANDTAQDQSSHQ
ncbi:putative endosulphine [Lupinus albus]|uniref:Putative endosulphine n=1 Tax=Lupinus albus TaxID=3870 RepID=A0A6A4P2I7_LUPAL|nr:putative endosulphine [Lupinus albus]